MGMIGSYLLESMCRGFQIQGAHPKEIRVISGNLDFLSLKHLREFNFFNLPSTVICSRSPTIILEFAKLISNIGGQRGEMRFAPADTNYEHSPNHVIIPDVTKLEALGWRQEFGLDESINKALNWVKKNL
jgi:nucleoside-diphosphate-sugar epimerase